MCLNSRQGIDLTAHLSLQQHQIPTNNEWKLSEMRMDQFLSGAGV